MTDTPEYLDAKADKTARTIGAYTLAIVTVAFAIAMIALPLLGEDIPDALLTIMGAALGFVGRGYLDGED